MKRNAIKGSSEVTTAPMGNMDLLLRNMPHAFMLVNKKLEVVTINKLGVKEFSCIWNVRIKKGLHLQAILSDADQLFLKKHVAKSFKNETVECEIKCKARAQQFRSFIMHFMPVVDEKGLTAFVSVNLFELTQIKRGRQEMADMEQLIAALFDTDDTGVVVVDAVGNIVKANNGFETMFGYKAGELLGKPWLTVIAPIDVADVKAAHKKVLAGASLNYERRGICKNGAYRNVYVSNRLYQTSSGEKLIIKTVRDLTESTKYKQLQHHAEGMAKLGGFEIDPITRQVLWTAQVYRIFEVEDNFRPTISWIEKAYVPAELPEFKQRLKEALTKGKAFDVVRRLKTAKGNYRWLHIKGTPLQLNAGLYRLIGTIQDITVQRNAEQEIERLSWVASHTNNAVLITDEKQRVQWVNKSFEKLTGFTLAEMWGKNPGRLLQGALTDKRAVQRIARRLRASQSSTGEILVNYSKDGKPIWLSADIAPIFRDGRLVNYIGIMTDITSVVQSNELRESQAVLLQQQQLFNAIANYFPNGVIGVLNDDLTYAFVGGTELDRMGLAYKSLVGDKIFDKIRPDLNLLAEPFLRRAFKGEHVSFEVEIGGSIYQVFTVPIGDTSHKITQALVVMLNITSSKKTEQELMRAFEQQKEVNEMKSKFVSIASHEFRTPLSTILSSAYLVGKYTDPDDESKREKHLSRIKQSVNNLTDILNDFLSLGKIEEGGVRNTPVPVELRSLLLEIIDEMQNYLKDGQSIKLNCKNIEGEVTLDKQHFKNVLLNLLSNAVKYSGQGKQIQLSAQLNKNILRVSVKDAGIGIPPEDQPHLFQTFFRANNVTNIQGTGMGLHIVKKYMDIMGGKISFTSKLNVGTTFTVRLPLH